MPVVGVEKLGDVIFSIKTWKKSLVTYKEISCSLHSIYSIHSYQLCISVNLILRRWLWVVSNCDMCLLSVKMWSSLAYGLVEQGSEALGSVGSQIGFVQVRMWAAICSLVYRYRTSTPPMHVHTL